MPLRARTRYLDVIGSEPRAVRHKANLRLALTHPVAYWRGWLRLWRHGLLREMQFQYRALAPVACELLRRKVDHIRVHFADHACEVAMYLSWLSGIPYSVTVHAHGIYLERRLIEAKVNSAQAVIAASAYNKRYIGEHFPGGTQDKIHVVHGGVRPELFEMKRRDPARQYSNEVVFVAVGRLVEQKGFPYLVEACAALKDRGVPIRCDIIGHGEMQDELERLIDALDVGDAVRLLGARDRAEVIQYLQRADCYILPCVTEASGMQDNIPYALMEAMAMGLPIVSTSVAGIPELVASDAGILVDQRDSEALAGAMELVAKMDHEKRWQMGLAGRRIIEEQFNVVRSVDKLVDLLAARGTR